MIVMVEMMMVVDGKREKLRVSWSAAPFILYHHQLEQEQN